MRYLLAAILLSSTAAHAQYIVDPAEIDPVFQNIMQDREGKQSLKCEVQPIKPALNFTFRFQAGYIVSVPLEQYRGPGNFWAVFVKITPEEPGHEAVFLASRLELPDIPETNVDGEIGGWYFLGEGRYRVEWTLIDNQRRSCRKDWRIRASLGRGERSVEVPIPPNTVRELSLRNATTSTLKTRVRPAGMTVLLHAAPLHARRTRLRPSDTAVLLGTLSSLIERLPVRSMRLVVFNLDQQSEIYRNDNFEPDDLDDVAQSLNQLELGSIDYKVLENRRGHLQMLANLINEELSPRTTADAVVFLGPTARFFDKQPEGALRKPTEGAPDFFYFQLKPYYRRAAPFPDSIQHAVNALKGKTTLIYSPGEFAKAIEQLETQLPVASSH